MATLQDMRSDAAKINIIPLQASVFNILRLFSGRRERPTKALRQPAGHRDQQPEISVATMRSSGQCMPSAGRLPITAVAHTSSTAIVPQRRRGHSSPQRVTPSWRQTWCDLTGKQTRLLLPVFA